ncbi:uncharacterized protein KY384_008395 [Bacidia gigantensis]|uniref:uncharacterized protein n=1 Tax=Bacidia gigantensis TaxID=2732470 RepID=UPI001D04906D|nr:uncharacterized protein KY384_008395 [Bacidia gigantensis]KAG8526966.1 hypothetical protein KY384_008395 [Bacidia gigantensis]
MASEHDPSVSEYQHEKHRAREADALHMLRKIASLVKPIMRQRGWRVGVLTEFFPEERNLLGLNINKGERICLRLRHAGDERQFMPIEQVTDTMLHELCHIVHGPHDEHFHNLWNQLRDEYENLIRKGYTGEGFLSTGHKLGGGRIPMHEARRRARAAAEKRQVLSAGSGQKLGGAPVRRGQDIRKVIADAAQRRTAVMKGCASGTATKEKEREIIDLTNKRSVRTKAEADDANEEAIMLAYIDLVQEEEREKENPAGSRSVNAGRSKAENIAAQELSRLKSQDAIPPIPSLTKPMPSTSTAPSRLAPSTSETIDLINPALYPSDGSWACEVCTLINPPTHLMCDACGIERRSPPPAAKEMTKAPPLPIRNKSDQHQLGLGSLKEDNSAKAVRTLREMEDKQRGKPQAPLGWLCGHCGQFMEREWWTCANCGEMKASS